MRANEGLKSTICAKYVQINRVKYAFKLFKSGYLFLNEPRWAHQKPLYRP